MVFNSMAARPTSLQTDRSIAWWLFVCAAAVFAMTVLGGVTRLTDSGLSMVDWQPIMGIIPPLSQAEWLATFEAYKQFPEYQKVNVGMDLEGFKRIFWFEYAHRVLGRGIGMLFALPFLYFLIRRRLDKPLMWKLVGIFALGGLQGLMGWYMVMSGLVDDPRVSHYRLTAHLGLAVIIFASILWVAWDIWFDQQRRRLDARFLIVPVVLALVICSGGFVAGTRAGLLFGTWPLMGDSFFPMGLYNTGFLASIFEDPVTIQFNHRMLAYLAIITVLSFGIGKLRTATNVVLRRGIYLMFALLAVQVALGIFTILNRVPVALAASHQGVALLLFAASLFCWHRLRAEAPNDQPSN